ncbi:MAG: hypothetical protein IKT29_00120 [Flavobacteriales bacterium]|nr:hypothetical protein [Flavobacteriales bacterium]
MKRLMIYTTLVLAVCSSCGVKKNIRESIDVGVIEKNNIHLSQERINSTLCSLSSTSVIEEEIRDIDTAGRTTRVITRHYEIKENGSASSCDTTSSVVIDSSSRHITYTAYVKENSRPTTSYKVYIWSAAALLIVVLLWWIKKKVSFI